MSGADGADTARMGSAKPGCGPLIPPLSESSRPMRQQIFERVRAAGFIPRVQVARDLSVSPASVTTLTSELIDLGLLEEISSRRDGDPGRGRPAVALGVRASAHLVAGIKLSDREHTAVIVDFAGNLIADEAMPRQPGAMELTGLVEATETLLTRACTRRRRRPPSPDRDRAWRAGFRRYRLGCRSLVAVPGRAPPAACRDAERPFRPAGARRQ